MIRSEPKPFAEIQESLSGCRRVFLLGCGGCAEASGTGGRAQVEEMKERLGAAGREITGTEVIDFLCQPALVVSRLSARGEELSGAEAVLTLCCGIGTQVAAGVLSRPVLPGCNTVSLGGARGEWPGPERCRECGDCLLQYTGGICPLTACAKSLLNGACGGARQGKCEVGPERECGWERIYRRLQATGRLELLKKFIPPKKWDRLAPRPEILNTAVFDLEK